MNRNGLSVEATSLGYMDKSGETVSLPRTRGIYNHVWEQYINQILSKLKGGKTVRLIIEKELFEKVGRRQAYAFTIHLNYGVVTNDLNSSTPAKDLLQLLNRDKEFVDLVKGKRGEIFMNSRYTLYCYLQ